MIRSGIRDLLDRDDAELALRLVSEGSASDFEEAESALRELGIESLLSNPKLFPALVRNRLGARASLPLLASAATRASLRQLGESDVALADYLAALLASFGLRDRAVRLALNDDQIYAVTADIAAELDDINPTRAFLVRLHLGNYALWLSGMFPGYIEHRNRRRGGPTLAYYEEMGKQGFALAASHRLANEHNMAELLELLAERFLVLRMALNRISDSMLFPSRTGGRMDLITDG